MNKVNLNRYELLLKFTALVVTFMLFISTTTVFDISITNSSQADNESKIIEYNSYPSCPFEVSSIVTEDGTWMSYNPNYPAGTPAQAYVAVSDTIGITLVLDVYGFWKGEETIYNGSIFDTATIPGSSNTFSKGEPKLPRITKLMEVPYDVDITTEVLFGESQVVDNIRIVSALPDVVPVWNLNVTTSYPVHTFQEVYSLDSLYPSFNVSVDGNTQASSIIFRGRRLLAVTFYPLQFNPLSDQLVVFSKMVVRLEYDEPAQIEPTRTSLYSEQFESLFEAFVVNYKPWENYTSVIADSSGPFTPDPSSHLSQTSDRAEYLIITTSEFQSAAKRLADWKTRKGLLTKIVIVDRPDPLAYDTVTDAAMIIRGIIQDAYNYWALAPTYVLLFGDCEFVPNDYGMYHLGSDGYDNDGNRIGQFFVEPTGKIGTDLSYFTIDGNDYFPDFLSGRISVDTIDQANIIVDKIIQYETSPPTSTEFYDNILSSASFEDHSPDRIQPPDGREDSGYEYVQTAETLTHYLDDMYTIHRNYTARYDGINPVDYPAPISYSGNVDFCTHLYDPTTSWSYPWIPSEQLPTNYLTYLEWGADNFSANINDGRFLIYNVDHGCSRNMKYYPTWDADWCDGWGGPSFNTGSDYNPNHLDLLTNDLTEELPLIISTGCCTGWFDGEIDQFIMGSPRFDDAYESIAEEITRMEGGAIAVIGATRHSYNHPSADLLRGMIQSFWPGVPGVATLSSQPRYELGAALLFGKLNVFLVNGIDGLSQISGTPIWYETPTTFEIFHLFGDPETQLLTDTPHSLNVDYPVKIGTNGRQKFVVTVTDADNFDAPVYYAKVCIQQNPGVYEVGYTNTLGQVIFDIDPAPTHNVNITVTKHNYIPHIDEIRVKPSNVILTLSQYIGKSTDSITFTISNFDPGSPTYIYFIEMGVLNLRATFNPGDTVKQGTVPIGPDRFVNVVAVQSETSPVAVKLFRRVSLDPRPDPYIYSHRAPNTWHLNLGGGLTFNNPCLEIYDGSATVLPTALEQFTSYKLHVTVYNDKSTPADLTEVTMKYARFGVGMLTWTKINQQPVLLNVPGNYHATAVIDWIPSLPGKTCLKIEISHPNDHDRHNNTGQENAYVLPLWSPGEMPFQLQNPTNETDISYLEVRQEGDHADVWEAQIVRYPVQSNSEEFVNISLHVNPPTDVEVGEWRIFTVSLYINEHFIDGISVNATKRSFSTIPDWTEYLYPALIFGGGVIALILIVYFARKR
ncbi:MAG: C25 family cysteine peptidase [Candidatus Thorarchaeota archaeon]